MLCEPEADLSHHSSVSQGFRLDFSSSPTRKQTYPSSGACKTTPYISLCPVSAKIAPNSVANLLRGWSSPRCFQSPASASAMVVGAARLSFLPLEIDVSNLSFSPGCSVLRPPAADNAAAPQLMAGRR